MEMDFDSICKVEDEQEKINRIYDAFDEDKRLSNKSGSIEFLTTVKYIKKYLKYSDNILDLGAGTGIYSLYFNKLGHEVTAVELVEKHCNIINEKSKEKIKVVNSDALSYMKTLPDDSMDIIFCFGPMYHMEDYNERLELLKECKRVIKEEGKIFISIINNDMVNITETFIYRGPRHLTEDKFYQKDFKLKNIPFVFHTIDEFKEMVLDSNLKLLNIIAQDGVMELFVNEINEFTEEEFNKWLEYHFYICKKPEMQGISNHNLFICEK
ncbi:class I SAM-dependent methyltransferase [Miniphocaeibacter halophilus]|uniref:Class I SAM-dependent methyltransferase n=1 Tax=Miniphocaeibacter halophilus TaxID=2931922 RepID=A0AC61MSL1_9FIRM|nr:class I SAM-dependent methyltransferase [Miniphocaeibacter halophilus]QQK08630.1 class I SAM-dependent methyltransferase [Miniphocaeibacter halophilus]